MAEADSEREARNRKLYRYISEAIRRADEGSGRARRPVDLFAPALEVHRQKIRENCEKLIFADPLALGRRAQELLWRKGYYETVALAKRLRSKDSDEAAAADDGDEAEWPLLEAHLDAGLGHYRHLLARIQLEMALDLAEAIDYPSSHVEPSISSTSEDGALAEWARSSAQACLVYMGDLCRYKAESRGGSSSSSSSDRLLAERHYYQAIAVDSSNGAPHNQLGTLYAGRNHHLDSVRHYVACASCERPFDGADDNLRRILEKNAKHLEGVVPSKEFLDRREAVKNFACRFLALVKCLVYDETEANLNEACATVLVELKDLSDCAPIPPDAKSSNEQLLAHAELQDSMPDHLSPTMLHRITMICLLCMDKLSEEDSPKALPLKAFMLAFLSQLLQKFLSDLIEMGFKVQFPRQIVVERNLRRARLNGSKDENNKNVEVTEGFAEKENVEKESLDVEVQPECDQVEEKEKNSINDIDRLPTEDSISKDVDNTNEENDVVDIQIVNNGKHVKTKPKKSLSKVRRRKRILPSDSGDESETEDEVEHSDCESRQSSEDEKECDSDDDSSEASYLTYSSSDDDCDDNDDDANNKQERKVNEMNNQNETNGFVSKKMDLIHPIVSDRTDKSVTDEKDNKESMNVDKAFNQELFYNFLSSNNALIAINMLFSWLLGEEEFIISCQTSGRIFFQTLISILNVINRQLLATLLKNTYNVELQYHKSLYEFHKITLGLKHRYKAIPLPEDYDLNLMGLAKSGLKNIKWNMHKYTSLSIEEANTIRMLRMIDFGLAIVQLDFGMIFNRRLKMYSFRKKKVPSKKSRIAVKKKIREPKGPHPKLIKTLAKNSGAVDPQSEGLMRNLGKLWLSAQVRQLESEVRADKHQRGLPAYIVVDAEALGKFTYLVKKLVASKRLIVLIPTIVLQMIDEMKKESGGARSAIRWLEFQLRSGCRFVRTQRASENHPIPCMKYPKKMSRDMQNFVQIVEFCHYFISQERIDDAHLDEAAAKELASVEGPDRKDNSSILILLTGNSQPEQQQSAQADFSYVGIANTAGVSIENIHDFCVRMRMLPSTKGGKNR